MFRTRLRELREASGYRSQQSFADAFGVAQSTVGNWEAGKREPNYETTIRLSKFFNVSIDYLLGNEHNLKQDDLSALFRRNLLVSLQLKDSITWAGDLEAECDYQKAFSLSESTYPLSLTEADEAANIVGEPLDDLLREDFEEYLQNKKPTPVSEDGLDDMEKLLMRYVKDLTPDQKQMLLAQMQVMIGRQKESSPAAVQWASDETTLKFERPVLS